VCLDNRSNASRMIERREEERAPSVDECLDDLGTILLVHNEDLVSRNREIELTRGRKNSIYSIQAP
jgi:hypothetical protein